MTKGPPTVDAAAPSLLSRLSPPPPSHRFWERAVAEHRARLSAPCPLALGSPLHPRKRRPPVCTDIIISRQRRLSRSSVQAPLEAWQSYPGTRPLVDHAARMHRPRAGSGVEPPRCAPCVKLRSPPRLAAAQGEASLLLRPAAAGAGGTGAEHRARRGQCPRCAVTRGGPPQQTYLELGWSRSRKHLFP